jgi:hypothetical protein
VPFVRIDALRADQAKLDGLGRAAHEALVDAIGIPADDLFQVLTSHDGTTGTFRYDTASGSTWSVASEGDDGSRGTVAARSPGRILGDPPGLRTATPDQAHESTGRPQPRIVTSAVGWPRFH